jgi:BirA family transcriptional regulator, biotin operon repressor / biotin---[acetyl-CoA-carboxylase] ligase
MNKKLTSTFADTVAILNDGHYHDGTTIGHRLQITRSAVWKMMKKLESYDIKIDAIKGKGYSLLEPLILLNQKKIKALLEYKNLDISIFETLTSTNDYLQDKLNAKKISICLAEHQVHGKGRMQRHWQSPFAQNIYLSCAYPFQCDVSELSGLGLVISFAIVKTLQTYNIANPLLIKWPNDIMYNHQKLAGNLIEIQAESYGSCHAIIGIGLNVNMLEDYSITQAWTSLRKITGSYIDRNTLCAALINQLITHLALFEKQGLNVFLSDWSNLDYLANKKISLKNGNEQIQGKVVGIDHFGRLRVQLKDGESKLFSAGDTSIIK